MKTALFACIVLLYALPFGAQELRTEAVSLPIGYAMVNAAKGDVTLHSPKGEPLPVSRGQVLPAGSAIETTKGSILLDLQDGSQVLVKPHSRVVLKSPAPDNGSYLELFLGKVLCKIQKRLKDAPSFQMGTPSAVITVRGTRFLVEVNKKQQTTVEVYEGVVQVSGIGAGASAAPVILGPGFGTNVDPDRPPQGPRRFGPDAMERRDPGEARDRQGLGEMGDRPGQDAGGLTGRESGEGSQGSRSSPEPD